MTHRAHELPADLRREIRGLANLVHERRLGLELAKLETEFDRWHRREVDAFELAALLHRFHEGEPRRLWLAYNTNRMAELIGRLRDALNEGILRETETSVELLATLRAEH